MKYIKTFENISGHTLYNMIRRYGVPYIKDNLKYNNDINKIYYDGNTLLILACGANNYYLVKDLIENNAELDIKNDYGKTALMNICSKYSSNGDLGYRDRIVKCLIDAGANVNIKDYDGNTAMMLSTDYKIIKMLIEAGADLNSKNNNKEDIFDIYKYDNYITTNIQIDYPEKYKEYLIHKEIEEDTDKYNL